MIEAERLRLQTEAGPVAALQRELEATRAEIDRMQERIGGQWTVVEMPVMGAPPATGDLRVLATNRPGSCIWPR